MFFPFTFNISTPANPFAESADPGQIDYASPTRTRPRRPPPPAQRASQASEERAGLSRKRGRWSPDLKAPACSPTADLTSTASAYIDSPAKYVQLDRADEDDQEPINEIRPAKRRRIVEITDSLISTAFSAAVIGTAVGLTAYRLWRDRGKEGSPPAQAIENFPPPPPYTERPEQPKPGPSYIAGGKASVPAAPPSATSTPVPRRTPARPGTNGRRTHMQSSRRKRPASTVFQRGQSPAIPFNNSSRSTTSHPATFTTPNSARSTPGPSSSSHQPNTGVQSGDELDDDEMEMSGQMDWMSSRLQDLINQGKKALGTEIVVGGADDADDGCDGWDDAQPEAAASQTHSSAGSGATTSRAATRTPVLGRSSSRASGASRRRGPRASSGSISSSSIRKHGEDEELGFEVLYQSPMKSAPSTKVSFNDDGTSEELRVAMERVRKAYGLR